MLKVRPIKESDLDCIFALAKESGAGMTNFPKNYVKLAHMIEKSLHSFQEKIEAPANHLYLFALEDTEEGRIIGISGIYGLTGCEKPLEYYSIIQVPLQEFFPSKVRTTPALKKVLYTSGPSEICSLYVTKRERKRGAGKLISLARFLFIKAFRERFTEMLFADLRGVIDPYGNSPFWDNLGRYFLPLSFLELMESEDLEKSSFLPKEIIYLNPLSQELKSVIGKTHINTQGAFQMLEHQGFIRTGEIDLYDGGPRVMARIDEIPFIKNSSLINVDKIGDINGSDVLFSNDQIDYVACMGKLAKGKDNKFCIDSMSAACLNIKVGDTIRYAIV